MRRRRIGWAFAAMTVSGAALAILWPHAREAGNILAAQDDPVKLSDIKISSTLQNGQKILSDQIEAALSLDLGHGRDELREFWAGRRLAVAGERDVVQAPQRQRRLSEALDSEEFTGCDEIEHVLQFGQ